MTTKAEQKRIDARINAAYGIVGEGVTIDMMDIPKVFALGRKLIAEGASDELLRYYLSKFVAEIRKN